MLLLKKRIIVTLILFALIGWLYAPSADAKSYTFKVATLAPKTVGWAVHTQNLLMPAMDRYTNGEIKLKWYWGGVMGDDKDYIQKMHIGQLDGGAFTGAGVALAIPEMSVLELPFMFNDFEEVDHIRKVMWKRFEKIAENRGYKIVVWSDQDFDQIYSVNWKMNTLADFGKAKIIKWFGPLEEKVLVKFGASPLPVGVPEITPSVRSGVADTLIAPAIWIVGSQLYTVMKYVNPVKIRYSPACTLVTIKKWDSYKDLTDRHSAGLESLRNKEMIEFNDIIRKDTQKAFAAMLKYGIEQNEMTPDDLALMKSKSKEIWYELADNEYPKALLEELISNLESFRAKKK